VVVLCVPEVDGENRRLLPQGSGGRRRLGTWRFFALNPYSVVGAEVTSAGAGGNAWKERLKLTTGRAGVRFVAWRPFGGRLGTSALLLSSCELRKCVRAGSSTRTFPEGGGASLLFIKHPHYIVNDVLAEFRMSHSAV
jgi:hypothetical protein